MNSLASQPGSRPSLAHLLLLSKFVAGRRLHVETPGHGTDRWRAALGVSEHDAIRQFLSQGLLVSCTTAEKLVYSFSSACLKQRLRERGLKLSGRKDQMAERLCLADVSGMENAVRGIELLKCSEAGQQFAQE